MSRWLLTGSLSLLNPNLAPSFIAFECVHAGWTAPVIAITGFCGVFRLNEALIAPYQTDTYVH